MADDLSADNDSQEESSSEDFDDLEVEDEDEELAQEDGDERGEMKRIRPKTMMKVLPFRP